MREPSRINEGNVRLVGVGRLAGQWVGEEFDDEQHVLGGEVGDATVDDRDVVGVCVRPVGAQIDHQLAPDRAERPHPARVDSRREAREPIPFRADVIARRVKPDQHRDVARQRAIVDDPWHRADGVEQHRGRVRRQAPHDVDLHFAERRVGDLRLLGLVGGEQLADAAALVAGDDHNRAVGRANLLVAA